MQRLRTERWRKKGVPGRPVVKTQHFQCRGTPIPGPELRSQYTAWQSKKKKGGEYEPQMEEDRVKRFVSSFQYGVFTEHFNRGADSVKGECCC